MYINTPNHKSIDLESYETYFKEKINFVLEKINKIFNKSQIDSPSKDTRENDLLKIHNQIKINEIKESTESIAQYLKTEHIILEEYLDFRQIQKLLNHALDSGNLDELKIILRLLNEFKKLNEFKFELLHQTTNNGNASFHHIGKENKKLFEKRYEEFDKIFFECEREYFDIYDGKYEEDLREFFELSKDQIKKIV